MPYLFDSNVIIYYINGVPRARQLLARYALDGISISTITYLEVLDGIPASSDPVVARERFDSLLDRIPLIGLSARRPSVALRYADNSGVRDGSGVAVGSI